MIYLFVSLVFYSSFLDSGFTNMTNRGSWSGQGILQQGCQSD